MTTIRINVGGKIFETFKSTVEDLAYFDTLFNSTLYNPEKEIFIDRDPEAFSALLNYLRDGNNQILKKHWRDLEFYGIEFEQNCEIETNKKDLNFFEKSKDIMDNCFAEFCMVDRSRDCFTKKIKGDEFLRKPYKMTEVMFNPKHQLWTDEFNLYIGQPIQDLGQNLLVYFDTNEIASKIMNSQKDYFDLIDSVTVYLYYNKDYKRERFESAIERGEFDSIYERCTGEELYVRFLHSKSLKNHKNFDSINIVPILVADEKISKKVSENHPTIFFEQKFAIQITFKKDYLSIINDIRIRSWGFVLDRYEIRKIESMTLFRWVKFNQCKYDHDNILNNRPNFRFDYPLPLRCETHNNPIKTIILKVKIDFLKSGMMNPKIVKYAELKLDGHAVRFLHGDSAFYTREKDGSFVLWYRFDFEFYLYPRIIQSSSIKLSLSEDCQDYNTVNMTSYFYEVLNYGSPLIKMDDEKVHRAPKLSQSFLQRLAEKRKEKNEKKLKVKNNERQRNLGLFFIVVSSFIMILRLKK